MLDRLQLFKTNNEKLHIFSDLLSITLNEAGNDSDFDGVFKKEVEDWYKGHKFESNDYIPFTLGEIYKKINKIKVSSSPGEDDIQNILLKNLPFDYVRTLLYHLINKAIKLGIPQNWKKAKIIMIPKKDGMTKDPEKYRPISLTSCLSKLTERLLKDRLYSFLEDNDVLVKQQAGFRNNRGASDNLTFFTQKLSETINRGKKGFGYILRYFQSL